MAVSSNFEARARERRRRERLRKKRIRMCISITVMAIIIISIISIIVSLLNKPENTTQNIPQTDTTQQQDSTQNTSNTSSGTIVTASIGGVVTGSYTMGATLSPEQTAELLGIPSPSEENELIQIIADANQKKRCYLTFEDGPSTLTPQVLDVLRRYNVKATFFMTGELVQKNPDIARRVYEEGHLIANRIATEDYDSLYASSDAFMTKLAESEAQIKKIINSNDSLFKLIRFPGGSPQYSSNNKYDDVKEDIIKDLANDGYYFCDWNTSNGDDNGSKTEKQLITLFKDYSKGYNNLISLMHDSSSKKNSVASLDDIIEYLTDQGYTFHKLDDIDYNPTAEDSENTSKNSSDEEQE